MTDLLGDQRRDARVQRMRARGQNEIADRYQAARDAGLLGGWSNDPDGLRKQKEERIPKIKEIMGGANLLVGGAPVAPGGVTGAAGTAYSLTALAALRDRGVLTEEEFQTQKKALLQE